METEARQGLQEYLEEESEAVEFVPTAGRLPEAVLHGSLGAYDVGASLGRLEEELTAVEATLAKVVQEYNSLLMAYQGVFMEANLEALADDEEEAAQEEDPLLTSQRSLVNASFVAVGEFERRRHEVNQRRRVLLRYCEYLSLPPQENVALGHAIAGIDQEANSVFVVGVEDPFARLTSSWEELAQEADEALPAWEEASGPRRAALRDEEPSEATEEAPCRLQEGA